MKILMVCLGNICRSPLAHGILEHKIKEHKLDWTIDSCGTGGWHEGELPDKRSIATAQGKGVDITNQCARKIKASDIQDFDLIFVMDVHNLRDVKALCHSEDEEAKVKLILNELYPGENRSVPDPYYGGINGFHDVYDMLDKACEKIVEKYR